MKNKKALSNIIGTLIIISLVLVAISVIWITISGLINNVSLSPEINCLDLKLQQGVTIDSACYNSETKQIETNLKRSLNKFNINSLSLTSETEEWECSSDCGNCIILNEGQIKKYYLPAENLAKEISLTIGSCFIETKNLGIC